MLNIGLDFNLELKRLIYPILFDGKNVCCHCAKEGTLVFVDKFGKETNQEIHAFDHIVCKNCNAIYAIQWQKDNESGRMYPTACDPSLKQMFFNLIDASKIKALGGRNEFPNNN